MSLHVNLKCNFWLYYMPRNIIAQRPATRQTGHHILVVHHQHFFATLNPLRNADISKLHCHIKISRIQYFSTGCIILYVGLCLHRPIWTRRHADLVLYQYYPMYLNSRSDASTVTTSLRNVVTFNPTHLIAWPRAPSVVSRFIVKSRSGCMHAHPRAISLACFLTVTSFSPTSWTNTVWSP
jgi:hypothetical protein